MYLSKNYMNALNGLNWDHIIFIVKLSECLHYVSQENEVNWFRNLEK